MKIDESAGDDAVAVELGRRLTGIRLAQNLSQRQLADAAGLGLRTIQRLEQGAVATQLSGFLRVCRVLGLLARIDRIFEEPPPSPIDQLKLSERRRQRATGRRKPSMVSEKTWSWGESS